VTLALLPRSSLSRWLTLATLVPAMLHFSAGHPDNHPIPQLSHAAGAGSVPGLGR